MHPCVFGGFDLKPQRLQSFLFVLQISKCISNAIWSIVEIAASVPR
jgi:hypothetical protein